MWTGISSFVILHLWSTTTSSLTSDSVLQTKQFLFHGQFFVHLCTTPSAMCPTSDQNTTDFSLPLLFYVPKQFLFHCFGIFFNFFHRIFLKPLIAISLLSSRFCLCQSTSSNGFRIFSVTPISQNSTRFWSNYFWSLFTVLSHFLPLFLFLLSLPLQFFAMKNTQNAPQKKLQNNNSCVSHKKFTFVKFFF